MGPAPLARRGLPSVPRARCQRYLCRAAAGLSRASLGTGGLKNGWRNWRVAKNCRDLQREAEQSEVKRCSSPQPEKARFSARNAVAGVSVPCASTGEGRGWICAPQGGFRCLAKGAGLCPLPWQVQVQLPCAWCWFWRGSIGGKCPLVRRRDPCGDVPVHPFLPVSRLQNSRAEWSGMEWSGVMCWPVLVSRCPSTLGCRGGDRQGWSADSRAGPCE